MGLECAGEQRQPSATVPETPVVLHNSCEAKPGGMQRDDGNSETEAHSVNAS